MSGTVRWGRTLALALPLIVLNAGWIAHSEIRTEITEISITTLFMGVAFLLFVLVLANAALRRLLPRAALRPAELFAVYVLLSLGTSVAGIGNIGFFAPFLSAPYRFGAQNNWERFQPLLPTKMLGPSDPAALKAFYEGRSSFFTPEALAAWGPALLFWGSFLLALFGTGICTASLLRRRWADQEYLPFPVVALPVELARGGPLLKERLLWAGFAVPFLLHSLNTLHSLSPTWPTLPINKSVELMDGAPFPLSGFGTVQLLLHPVGVGFGYLVNTDVLFSLWFFWALKKGLNFWGTTMNWRDPGPDTYNDRSEQFPFVQYQAWGAWLAVCLAALWTGRGYFTALWHRAWEGDPAGEERGEALTARQALVGAVAGGAIACGLLWWAGAPLWLPLAFLGLHGLILLALARLEAETAVLSPLLMWIDPQRMLTTGLGTANLSRPELAHLATLSWFNLDFRAAMLPQQVQGFVGMRRLGGALPPLAGAMLLALAVGIASALLWDMQLYHTLGASTANVNAYRINMGNSVWFTLSGWLSQPKPPEPRAWAGAAVGAGIVGALSWLRMRFVGFPLSPAAYVLNLSWANELFWLDLFVAWILKAALLRYGGIRLYRASLPFFLGLILGDFVAGAGWSLVGLLLGVELYRTFPN